MCENIRACGSNGGNTCLLYTSNTRADGKGVSYSLGGTYQVGTSADKLYAVWQIQTYTVTFEAGEGGSLAQGMQTVFTDIKYNTPWNQAVTEPAPVPDEEYYFCLLSTSRCV